MSNTKHTPGPWKIETSYEEAGIEYLIETDNEPFIARIQQWNYMHESDASYHAEANAKLIAAAPELLGQLQNVYNFISTYGIRDESGKSMETDLGMNEILAAIKKATE